MCDVLSETLLKRGNLSRVYLGHFG